MLPDPLHPAIVHFPIVFMILRPIAAAVALWAIRRGSQFRLAWAVPTAFAAALTLSAWVAVETGEGQEERVEDVVAERAIHPHEEAAERFLVLSGFLLAVSGAGLLGGPIGRMARLATIVGAVGVAGAGAQVGHTGGKLVYQYGAASAYTQSGPNGERPIAREVSRHDNDD